MVNPELVDSTVQYIAKNTSLPIFLLPIKTEKPSLKKSIKGKYMSPIFSLPHASPFVQK